MKHPINPDIKVTGPGILEVKASDYMKSKQVQEQLKAAKELHEKHKRGW